MILPTNRRSSPRSASAGTVSTAGDSGRRSPYGAVWTIRIRQYDARGAIGGRLRKPFRNVYEIEIARGGHAFSPLRHDSHLKMLVSGSSRSAISPRLRSGSSRLSYGYLRVTGLVRTTCPSGRVLPPRKRQ